MNTSFAPPAKAFISSPFRKKPTQKAQILENLLQYALREKRKFSFNFQSIDFVAFIICYIICGQWKPFSRHLPPYLLLLYTILFFPYRQNQWPHNLIFLLLNCSRFWIDFFATKTLRRLWGNVLGWTDGQTDRWTIEIKSRLIQNKLPVIIKFSRDWEISIKTKKNRMNFRCDATVNYCFRAEAFIGRLLLGEGISPFLATKQQIAFVHFINLAKVQFFNVFNLKISFYSIRMFY